MKVAVAGALAVLVAWSFWLRWDVLAASPFPLGVDGYYYPIQVRAVLETGHVGFAALPITFWWMAPFAAATDPIVGAKLAAALGGALVALPAYALGARLGRGRGPGLVAAALAACSMTSTYLSIEYVKQGIGWTVALAAIWLVLRAIDQRTRVRLAVAVLGVAAAALTHKLAIASVLIVTVPAVIEDARVRGALRGRRLLYVAAACVVVLAGAVIVSYPQLRGLFTTTARWSAPAQPGLPFGYEALLAAVVAIAAIFCRERTVLGWVAIGFGVFLAIPFLDVDDPQGLAYRLRVSAFVPLALCGAIVARSAQPLAARIFGEARVANVAAAAACGLVVFVFAVIPRDRHEGEILTHPALVASALALGDHVPAGKTVVTHERHIAFMINWYTRAPIALRPESIAYADRVRVVLPRSWQSEPYPLEHALLAAARDPLLEPPIALHPLIPDGFVMIPEATWSWILTQLSPRSRRHWERWPTI